MRDKVPFQNPKSRGGSLILLAAIFIVLAGGILAIVPLAPRLASLHAYGVTAASMEPTLYSGDKILVNESYYAHHALADGDLVVFRHGDTVLVKRVSALAGETIEGKEGVLVRKGVALVEPYAAHSKDNPIAEIETFAVRQVRAGELFVTGDSRDRSFDSRSSEFGPVYASDVLGKVAYVYLSSHAGQIGRSF